MRLDVTVYILDFFLNYKSNSTNYFIIAIIFAK